MSKSVHFVIPAAGLGSRFTDLGYDIPKPLIPVLDIPMIFWVLSNLPLQETDKITIITRGNIVLDKVWVEYGLDKPKNLHFLKINEITEGPAITAALAVSVEDFENPLVILNSDQYVDADLSDFVNQLRSSQQPIGSILTMEANDSKWSYVGRDSGGRINSIIEKQVISNEATVGIYGWSHASIFIEGLDWLKREDLRVNGEFYVAPTYNYLVLNRIPIVSHNVGPVSDRVHGLGTVPDYLNFSADSRSGTLKSRVLLRMQEMFG